MDQVCRSKQLWVLARKSVGNESRKRSNQRESQEVKEVAVEERSEAEELAETQNVDGILTAAFKVTSGSKSLAVQSRIGAQQDFKMNKLKFLLSNYYEIA